jgi:hypothetical protein
MKSSYLLRNPLKCNCLYRDIPQDLRHDDNCEKLEEEFNRSFQS